jgi:glutathione S-transferase
MLEFYYAPGTVSPATHIALEDAGAEYRPHRLNFEKEEQRSPEYLAINPKGRAPALVTPRGVLTETPALLAFVAQSYPAARLAPLDDPFAFGQIQAFNNFLCATLHVAHAHKVRGHRWVDDEAAIAAMQRKVPESVGACFAYIEDHALAGKYVMGETYSIADPYLFTAAQWMEADSIDPAKFPKVLAHREMMRQRKSVQDALRMESEGTGT